MDGASTLLFFVNGIRHDAQHPDPKMTLLQYLRSHDLVGTKLGCGEGGCGACTVMLSYFETATSKISHYSANACLTPLCSLDGFAITTIEGIGGMKQGLHPIQSRLATLHGSQCGFCTPGIVMSLYSQFRNNPGTTQEGIEECLDGNLCRCTGYRPILDAAKSLAGTTSSGGGCCGGRGDASSGCCMNDAGRVHRQTESVVSSLDTLDTLRSTEPIFPPYLSRYTSPALRLQLGSNVWYQPCTLDSFLELKAAHPDARIIVGNTEVGIEVKFKAMEYPIAINPTRIQELKEIEETSFDEVLGIRVGAAVTINRLRDFIQSSDKSSFQKRGLNAIYHMLSWFASNQIRNVACVAGNIVTASPISDLNPMLICCGATLQLMSSAEGVRQVPIKDFFLGYRKVDLKPTEILHSVFIPYTAPYEFVLPLKQARRREDDISIVTAGIRVKLQPDATTSSWVVEDFAAAFGGMAPTTKEALKTAQTLIGQPWSREAFETAIKTLRQEFDLPDNVPGGQAQYRMALATSFLFKAFLTITSELQQVSVSGSDGEVGGAALPPVPVIDSRDQSAAGTFITAHKPTTRGEQTYTLRSTADPADPTGLVELPRSSTDTAATAPGADSVGQSLMHKSALLQVTGEALYTGDIPLPATALHAALVCSTRPHARLLNVDVSEAESCAGFVAYLSSKDVTGSNKIGAVVKDEEIFATEEVHCVGAVIGVIVAATHEQATLAARKVKVEYEDLPVTVSIEEAIASQSFFPGTHEIVSGDLAEAEAAAEVTVSGTARVGGQDHFYLETNCSVAIPKEYGQLEIFSSTQNLTKTQNFCASVCGIPAAQVVARCKRMGGGFGGKETRSVFIACTAALAAHLLNRTVSINVERDVDMSTTGQRHAFQINYRAGCTRDGKLNYLDLHLYSNAGYSLDLSQPVMDRALFHCDNVYKWPALRARGTLCKTNQPTHTAFRGFGGPQGMIATEIVMEHLAQAAGIDPHVLRQNNFYADGERTHFGQTLEAFYVPRLWSELSTVASTSDRCAAVDEFNRSNRWKKRGLAMMPTKFGINFTAKFMNQGGALVHVYTDGTVLIAHGGTEMGQGLHTKMIQVAVQAFGIPDTMVHVAETATNTVANASPTAASMSTDLYGMAVLDACSQILARLVPVRAGVAADAVWKEVINAAFFQRVDLSAHGYYAVDSNRCGYDWDKVCTDNSERGLPFNYFTQGVAATEVELDCLTGDCSVLRVDIVMDVGKSINPALDIGQIEGAFVQGMGWSTTEELVWGDDQHPWVRPGQLFTRGPGTYKIPSFNDVPRDFRVHLSDTDNRFCVHSSKAVGEPPLFLGCSTYLAIQHAVNAARLEIPTPIASLSLGASADGSTSATTQPDATLYYRVNFPATSERIRMACADQFTALCTGDDVSYHPKGSW